MTSAANTYYSGPGGIVDLDPCEHDWRVNPVVCTTTPTGDCELWMCLKCGATKAGPRIVPPSFEPGRVRPGIRSDGPSTFAPETWEKRP